MISKIILLLILLATNVPAQSDWFWWWDDDGDTTPPDAPLNLLATGGAGKIDLSWDAVADATAYNVYRTEYAINYNRISANDSGLETSVGNWTGTGNHSVLQSDAEANTGTYSLEVINADLLAGWDFTSGWTKLQIDGTTTSNSYQRLGSAIGHGVVKSIYTVGKTYLIEVQGTIEGLSFGLRNAGSNTNAISEDFGSYRFTAVDVNLYVRTEGTGTTTITRLQTAEVGNSTTNYVSLDDANFDALVEGNDYELSYYYKSPYLNGDSISYVIGDITAKHISSSTWTQRKDTITATASTVSQPLKFFINQADTIYIDDISIVQLTETDTSALTLLAEDEAGVTYEDSPLDADSIYYYGIKAKDAAGNLSEFSNVAGDKVD